MPRRAQLGALGRVLVEDRVGVVDVDQHAGACPPAAAPATRACRRGRSAAGARCRARASSTGRDAIISSSRPEGAVDQHAGGALHRLATAAPRWRRARARRRAARPLASSAITSAMLSPGSGASRCGEYGAGLLATASARQLTPATPATANASPSSAQVRATRRRSSGRARRRSDCRASGRRSALSGAPQRPAAAPTRAACTARWCGRPGRRPARCRRWPCRAAARAGCSSGCACSCARMSGEALTSAQSCAALPRHGDRRLRARPGAQRTVPHAGAVAAVAVPLRKAAAGSRPQYADVHGDGCSGGRRPLPKRLAPGSSGPPALRRLSDSRCTS